MTDVIRLIPEDEYERGYCTCLDTISEAEINSLCWRAIESIDKKTIRQFLGSKYCNIDPDYWYNKLVELSTIPNHPFNADYFHALMMRFTMPKRDGRFQFFSMVAQDMMITDVPILCGV